MFRRSFLGILSAVSASGFVVPMASSGAVGALSEERATRSRVRRQRGLSGWRARIGILYPEDGVLDDEYARMAPPGVTIHVARIPFDPPDPEASTVHACSLFKMIDPDCVTYGSNGGSFWAGVGGDQRLAATMARAVSCPVSTASTGMIRAFKKLDIRRLAIASPYWKEASDKLRAFVEGNGIEVVSLVGPELQNGEQISSTPPEVMYRWALEADRHEADGVLLPCTNLRTLEIIEPLEHDLRKPVVSGNQAMIWDALSLAGVHQPREGFGKLFMTQ